MKKKLLIFALVGVMATTAACSKPANDAAAQVTPTPELKKTVEAFGTVEVNDIENINVDFSAPVIEVKAKDGQRVKKGDVLIVLDMKNYLEQIKSKEHELNISRLEADKLQSKLIEEQLDKNTDPDIKKLVNDLNYANDLLQKASKDLEAQEKLYKTGAVSKYDYDEFVKSVDEKRKNAEDIKYNLDIMLHEKKLGNKDVSDSIAIQNEKTATIQNELNQMKSNIGKAYISENNIISDIDNGIVYEIGCKPGDTLSSFNKVLSIMNLDTMVVKADVAEEFIKDVKLGANVEITPVADKSKQYKGKVTSISNRAVEQNGETVVPVEISIDNKGSFLLPNFNVDIKIYME
ncbi:MAG: HlyD family secretion protein [Caulobacteraceae bacterium]